MTRALRERFDRLLEDALEALPPQIRAVTEEVPIIVVDAPDAALTEQLRKDGLLKPQDPPDAASPPPSDDPADLLGLFSGVAITDASLDGPVQLPSQIHIFREALVDFAGGWDQEHADDEIYEEIRITLIHEIGHHFGLDEDDLDRLGYA